MADPELVARLEMMAKLFDLQSSRRVSPEAKNLRAAIYLIAKQADELDRLREALSRQNDEISQVLGKALGYPWYKDDPVNFPGATETDGVCVGEHVAESLADEAAALVAKQAAALEVARRALEPFAHEFDSGNEAFIDWVAVDEDNEIRPKDFRQAARALTEIEEALK